MRALVISVLVLCCCPAWAAGVDTLLDEADRRYADLDYRGAADRAERAARDDSAAPAQKIHAYERAGLSWLVLGQKQLAKEAFDRLFQLDDAHAIDDPSLSGRQREFIEEQRQAIQAKRPQKTVVPPVEPEVTPAPVVPVTPPPPTKPPLYKRWYVWTPVAIVVVGVGLGVGLGLGLQATGPRGTLPPGTVGLALRF